MHTHGRDRSGSQKVGGWKSLTIPLCGATGTTTPASQAAASPTTRGGRDACECESAPMALTKPTSCWRTETTPPSPSLRLREPWRRTSAGRERLGLDPSTGARARGSRRRKCFWHRHTCHGDGANARETDSATKSSRLQSGKRLPSRNQRIHRQLRGNPRASTACRSGEAFRAHCLRRSDDARWTALVLMSLCAKISITPEVAITCTCTCT